MEGMDGEAMSDPFQNAAQTKTPAQAGVFVWLLKLISGGRK
jgi:hypothetical protein